MDMEENLYWFTWCHISWTSYTYLTWNFACLCHKGCGMLTHVKRKTSWPSNLPPPALRSLLKEISWSSPLARTLPSTKWIREFCGFCFWLVRKASNVEIYTWDKCSWCPLFKEVFCANNYDICWRNLEVGEYTTSTSLKSIFTTKLKTFLMGAKQ